MSKRDIKKEIERLAKSTLENEEQLQALSTKIERLKKQSERTSPPSKKNGTG
jgi:prefoldin subunit 5